MKDVFNGIIPVYNSGLVFCSDLFYEILQKVM